MAEENRIVTLVPWHEQQDKGASPPEYTCPRYTDVNDWQDRGARAMGLDQSLGGFDAIEGCLKFYGQSDVLATGGATAWFTLHNWYRTGAPNTASRLDLLSRIIELTAWVENAAADLPTGVTYDPNVAPIAGISHVWYTGSGAADGNPPTGNYLTVAPNVHIYSSSDGSELRCSNHSGADRCMVIMGTILEQI